MPKVTDAPKHLSSEAKAWWCGLVAEYGLQDQAGRLLLQTALEAFDRMRQSQKAIKRDGATVKDRWRQVKSHPALITERDSRAQLLMALRQLNFDLEPLRDRIGRPPGR